MGCGPSVYVPRQAVETEVCRGLSELLSLCSDPEGFTRQVNVELCRLWEECTGHADIVTTRKEIERAETKIANIRRAVEDGFADASGANVRLRELVGERGMLTASLDASEAPKLDSKTVMAYCRQTEKSMTSGHPAERKRPMRAWVQEVKLEPHTLNVKISYRLPEFVMKGLVAGAGIVPNALIVPFRFELVHAAA
jgi:hypothetical protein